MQIEFGQKFHLEDEHMAKATQKYSHHYQLSGENKSKVRLYTLHLHQPASNQKVWSYQGLINTKVNWRRQSLLVASSKCSSVFGKHFDKSWQSPSTTPDHCNGQKSYSCVATLKTDKHTRKSNSSNQERAAGLPSGKRLKKMWHSHNSLFDVAEDSSVIERSKSLMSQQHDDSQSIQVNNSLYSVSLLALST